MRLFFWKKSKPEPQNAATNIAVQTSRTPTAKQEYFNIYPVKSWCEIELTPLAWSRVVIRLLPILRDFNCDFSLMQKPRPDTKVEKEIYHLFLATIEELYGKSYSANSKSVSA